MYSMLDPTVEISCQRWGNLQAEAEVYRRNREQLNDSRSRSLSRGRSSRWRRS